MNDELRAAADHGLSLIDAGRLAEAEAVLLSALGDDPDDAVLNWYAGLLFKRRGELHPAAEALRKACQIDPTRHEAAAALAWVLHDLGELAEATDWSRQALAARRDVPLLQQAAWLALRRGDYAASVEFYDEAIARCPPGAPEAPLLYEHRASAMQELGRVAEAEQQLRYALWLHPDEPGLMLAHAWLSLRLGRLTAARNLAARVVERAPGRNGAAYLQGMVAQEQRDFAVAEHCFASVAATDPNYTDALLRRAQVLQRLRPGDDGIEWLLSQVLQRSPGLLPAETLLVQTLLDRRRPAEARRRALACLRHARGNADLWRLLAIANDQLGRFAAARRAVQRACRLGPDAVETWRLAAWLAHDDGRHADAVAAVRRVLALASNDVAAATQAAFVLQSAGAVAEAALHAERAIGIAPAHPEAWRALGHVRQAQGRLEEADEALQTSIGLAGPGADRDARRQRGALLIARERLGEALLVRLRLAEDAPDNALAWLELANIHLRLGQFGDAQAALQRALALRPRWPAARLAEARLRTDRGEADDWTIARALCLDLLRERHDALDTARILLQLAARGAGDAEEGLRMLPRPHRIALLLDALAWTVAHRSIDEVTRIADLALALFPEDPGIIAGAFYAAGLRTVPDLPRVARDFARSFRLASGNGEARPQPPVHTRSRRIRVAYLAAHLHPTLLSSVLAAHDPAKVELFLYTDQPLALPGLAAANEFLSVQQLRGVDLAASFAANRIDVAVDTTGLHPLDGQLPVLQALSRRIAPVQCAWLGSWGPSGGLFDALLTDDDAVPPALRPRYAEEIVALPGGQWAWTPPARAPAPGPLPALQRGSITFGVTARSMRLSTAALAAWCQILARCAGSRLVFLGRQRQDRQFRARLERQLREAGIDPARVEFHPHVTHHAYLLLLQQIDIVLDPFPAGGGLSNLDALWMGAPVVTRAGYWAGQRQGASVLGAIGRREWIADDDAAYVELAVALASDTDRLANVRAALREQIRTSPLTDGARLAAALEDGYARLLARAAPVVAAQDGKERCRALARRSFEIWRDDGTDLVLPRSDTPAVSVVVVTFNQVGLSLQTLQAIADQSGVALEVIVVDNASSDATTVLLDRLRGATILRNDSNLGFLEAANQGAQQARGRHILFLNSDAILQPGAIAAALARIESDSAIGIVGGRIVLADGTLQEAGNILYRDGSAAGYGRGSDPAAAEFRFTRDTDYVSGAFLLIRSSLWHELGGFDPAYAPAYYEDVDLCMRAWRAGSRVVYEPRAVLEHLEWGSAGSNDWAVRQMEKNRRLFVERHPELASRSPATEAQPLVDRWRPSALPRVLVLDNAVPHVTGGAGLPRARSTIRACAEFPVTFYPLWDIEDDWRDVYATVPPTVEVMLGRGLAGLERFLEQRRGLYDVLLVSRPPNLERVRALQRRRPELFAGMQLVYDAEALFALREIGQAEIAGRKLGEREACEKLQREIELAAPSTRVLVVSEQDAGHYRRAGFGDVRTAVHGIAPRRSATGSSGRNGLLFVGALHRDTPNEDGLVWFATEVLPLLPALLGAAPTLTIVGACHAPRVAALQSDRIRLVGRQDRIEPFYDAARVFIAPSRFAGGVPLKVIEAGAHGIPVVASDLLVRQLGWQAGSEIVAASDAASFAAGIALLDRDDRAWSAMQEAAWKRVAKDYAPTRFAQQIRAALTDPFAA